MITGFDHVVIAVRDLAAGVAAYEQLLDRRAETPTHRDGVAHALIATRNIAVELMAAAEGIDYHAPLRTSARLQPIHDGVRALSPHFTADRYWADEMSSLQAAVLDGGFTGALLPLLGN